MSLSGFIRVPPFFYSKGMIVQPLSERDISDMVTSNRARSK
jgi:hypothetical protein